MRHPLLPSLQFSRLEFISKVTQSWLLAPSIPAKISLFLANIISQNIVLVPPIHNILWIPSMLIYSITGDSSSEVESKLNKIKWIAPVASIALTTLIAHVSYLSVSSAIMKGSITGVHSIAMMMFTVSPASWAGLITLKSCLWQLPHAGQTDNFDVNVLHRIRGITKNIEALTFAVSSIALTVLTANPIIANAIAYPTASLVSAVASRLIYYYVSNQKSSDDGVLSNV